MRKSSLVLLLSALSLCGQVKLTPGQDQISVELDGNAQGAEGEANVWGKRSEWVDYSGVIDGEKVGVVIMDHPGNPRHPTYWHSRGYGLHSVNPFGVSDFLNDKTKDGSMTIEPGQHARFRYRVMVHPGDAKSANIAALYKQYAAGN